MPDQHPSHRNGNWRNAVIGAFGAGSLLIGGWMLTEASTERRSMSTMISTLQREVAANRSEIAVLKEQRRSDNEIVKRHEEWLSDLRHEREQERELKR